MPTRPLTRRRRRAAAAEVLAVAETRAEPVGERAAAARSRARGGGRAAPPADPAGEGREPDPEEIARAIVLKQLSMAPRSRQQLADKLRQRGCPDDVSARVLDRMEAVGLVDDDAYAQMVVRSKQATRGLAKRALAHDLRGKGVADDDDRGSSRLDRPRVGAGAGRSGGRQDHAPAGRP